MTTTNLRRIEMYDLQSLLVLVNEILEKDKKNQIPRQRWKWKVIEIQKMLESMIKQ